MNMQMPMNQNIDIRDRVIPYSEMEDEFNDADESRNNSPRYQDHNDAPLDPSVMSGEPTRGPSGEIEAEGPTQMNGGGGDPGLIVTGDPFSPSMAGNTDANTWDSTHTKNDNPADGYKKLLTH
jgi:hypothetical protein